MVDFLEAKISSLPEVIQKPSALYGREWTLITLSTKLKQIGGEAFLILSFLQAVTGETKALVQI